EAPAGAAGLRGVQRRARQADPDRDPAVRQGPQGLRAVDRAVPAQQVPARRPVHPDRGHRVLHRPVRRRPRPGRAHPGRRRQGEVVELAGAERRARPLRAAARRLRLHERIPRRPRLARRPGLEDLGRLQRDHEGAHRPRPRPLSRPRNGRAMFTTRPDLDGTFGMVASTHWLASSSAMAVLERGGNAADAAVAGGLVLQVVEPHLNGPGGDMALLVHPADADEPLALSGTGPAPAAATIATYADLGLSLVPGAGALAAAVPGQFDAWLPLGRAHVCTPVT